MKIKSKIRRMKAVERSLTRSLNGGDNAEQMNPPQKQEFSQLFEKKFHFQQAKVGQWKLPPPKALFGEYYQLETLQTLKQQLNAVKCKLNDYGLEDWSAHTRRRDPAGEIPWRLKNETNAEFVTVAWCKFFECLHKFPLVKTPQINSLHLCEAPGAFVAALNHYLFSNYEKDKIKWNWLSTTLNPYYEGNPLNKMIIDDRFMLYTLDRWLFHEDFTGNIIDRNNIEHMRQQCIERFENVNGDDGLVHLITADGSIDCVEAPDCQEEYVATLHFAELTAALSILADGGSFVLKMFTLFEATSVCKIYLLNCVFEHVNVFKPATSKRGNSEMYIICLGFKKQTQYLQETLHLMSTKLDETSGNISMPLFAKSHLPMDFLLQQEICARLFMNLQIQAIESNIYSYELKPRHDARRSHLLRTQVCNEFYERYSVQPLPEELTILYRCQGKIQMGLKTFVYMGSYTEREIQRSNSIEEQIFMLRGSLNELEKSLSGSLGVLQEEEQHQGSNGTSAMLKVYRGKPYDTLNSSLFASVHVLLMRLKLQQLFDIDPMWHDTPKCTLDYAHILPLDCTSSSDFSIVQQKYLLDILNAILERQPQHIVFSNVPFLAHLSVSMLRYLSLHVFSTLSIKSDPVYSITLSVCTYGEHELSALTLLRDLLATDKRVLCVVDILHLHRNKFCKSLTEYNNLLLLKNFKLMLN